MFLASTKKLRSFGIIGMNQRNFGLVAKYNPRHLYPLVDDKLKTKLLAHGPSGRDQITHDRPDP